jgi:hypothetical protein
MTPDPLTPPPAAAIGEGYNPDTHRTISLSDRAPVVIVEAEWPILARVTGADSPIRPRALRRWWLIVRAHADGRRLIYGGHSSDIEGERDIRAGYLVDAGATPTLWIIMIRLVAAEIGHDDLALACIQALPAEVL